MEHISAKYALWGAVIAAVLTAAVTLYIHNDEKSEQKKAEEIQRKADKSKSTANLTISNVYLPPINTKIESAFFAEISNNSLNVANNIQVKINFGEATVHKCETLPLDVFETQKEFKSSIVSFPVESIQKKDKLYIYCLLSRPVFKSILLTGPNLFSNEELKYENYSRFETSETSSYITFFKVIGSGVAVVFIIYFSLVIINLLSKLPGMKLE